MRYAESHWLICLSFIQRPHIIHDELVIILYVFPLIGLSELNFFVVRKRTPSYNRIRSTRRHILTIEYYTNSGYLKGAIQYIFRYIFIKVTSWAPEIHKRNWFLCIYVQHSVHVHTLQMSRVRFIYAHCACCICCLHCVCVCVCRRLVMFWDWIWPNSM